MTSQWRMLIAPLLAALFLAQGRVEGLRDAAWGGSQQSALGYRGTASTWRPRVLPDEAKGSQIKEPRERLWMEHISADPRVTVFHNFLTPFECSYLIHKAQPLMQKSQVVNSTTGEFQSSNVRTSSGTFLRRNQDDVIGTIERRIAHFSHVPVEHGEPLHILHYEDGQEYRPHWDYFHDAVNTANGGQRVATMVMYLSDVEEGGETIFVDGAPPRGWPQTGWSKCAEGKIAVRAKKGDAVLFWNLHPDASKDHMSMHGKEI